MRREDREVAANREARSMGGVGRLRFRGRLRLTLTVALQPLLK